VAVNAMRPPTAATDSPVTVRSPPITIVGAAVRSGLIRKTG
jgi:hypothetical protein